GDEIVVALNADVSESLEHPQHAGDWLDLGGERRRTFTLVVGVAVVRWLLERKAVARSPLQHDRLLFAPSLNLDGLDVLLGGREELLGAEVGELVEDTGDRAPADDQRLLRLGPGRDIDDRVAAGTLLADVELELLVATLEGHNNARRI